MAELEGLDGVITLSVVRGVSVKPRGDVVTAHVLNRTVDAVLAAAQRARRFGPVSVSTAELRSMLDRPARGAIDDDYDEAPWEEMERGLRHHGRLSVNFLLLMGVGAAIAVAGLVSTPVPQALALAAAGIVAPAFEPVAKLALGLVNRSFYVIRRAALAVLAGYLVMMLVGALSYGALRMVGSASPDTLAQGEAFATIISPTAADWVISAGGAVAGLLLITAFRDAVIPGALIALALVPAAALVGVGVASGQPDVALGALRRVALDVTLVIVLGGAVVLLKQRLVHRNRPPMS